MQRRVVSRLVQAASAALPRAKGSQLARAWKSRSVDLTRQMKKDFARREGDADDTQAIALPQEVMQAILAQLQPVSLGSMACVSREWRAAVADDLLWRRFLPPHTIDDAWRQNCARSTFVAGVRGTLRFK